MRATSGKDKKGRPKPARLKLPWAVNRRLKNAVIGAASYGVSIGAALLFGPKGGAYIELLHFLAAEKVHGLHRNGASPNPHWTEDTKKRWYDAQKTGNWPRMMDENGNEVSMDMAEEQGRLPEGVVETLREMWRRNPVLHDYTGTNRLLGDIPYQIVEDVVDVILQKRFSPLDEIQKARYNRIIEDANEQGNNFQYVLSISYTHRTEKNSCVQNGRTEKGCEQLKSWGHESIQ